MIDQQPGALPERDQGLISRIAAWLFRNDRTQATGDVDTPTTASAVVTAETNRYDRYFRIRGDRRAVYADADEMDDSSEEVSVALDIIADNATSSEDGEQLSFTATSDDTRVQAVLDQVNTDGKLEREVYSLTRNAVKYGDFFGEIVVDGKPQIVELRQLDPATMHRNEKPDGTLQDGEPRYDSAGNCLNSPGECAFEQRHPETDAVVAAFYPFQIVHGRFNWDGMSRYGRSHLRVARIIWRKLKALDESMIIGRLIRAYPKLKHKVDTTGLAPTEARTALKDYIRGVNQQTQVGSSRDKQYSVSSDLFIGAPKVVGADGKFYENASDIEVLESQGHTITNIDDIKTYFHRKLISTLRIPPALMGWEEQINAKATLSGQDVEFVRFLRRVQSFVGQTLEQIYDTAIVLAGMDATTVEYDISWPALNSADESQASAAYFARAQGDQIYLTANVITPKYLQGERFGLDADEIAAMQADLDAQAAEQQGAARADAAAKVAAMNGNGNGATYTNGSNGKAVAQEFVFPIHVGNDKLTDVVAQKMADGALVAAEKAGAAVGASAAAGVRALESTGARIIEDAVVRPGAVGRRVRREVEDAGREARATVDRTGTDAVGLLQRTAGQAKTDLGLIADGTRSDAQRADAAADRADAAAVLAQQVAQEARQAIAAEIGRLELEFAQAVTAQTLAEEDSAVAIEYDDQGRVIGATTPDGRFIVVEYDASGRVKGAHEGQAP